MLFLNICSCILAWLKSAQHLFLALQIMHGMAGSYSMERRSLNLHFMTCSKTALASSIALITSVVYANEAEVSQLPTITVNATQNSDALYTSKIEFIWFSNW